MGAGLPKLSREKFARGIARVSPEVLTEAAMAAMYAHYEELRLWNQRLALIGPGTAGEVLARHFGEALAALPLIERGTRWAVDVGSGAGFPGLVVAAARPEMSMVLVEARERKWSFLASAVRKAALPCRPLNARVTSPLPSGLPASIDLVTVRALKLDVHVLAALARRLSPQGCMLLWLGEETPELPRELSYQASVRLAGGERRRILQLRPAAQELEHA
jgi:16S rRNA (guanine(527)-N(7))-methyltransferase RsmG